MGIRSYACRVRGHDEHHTVHAESIGKAKKEYFDLVSECCPDLRFTDIRARCLGGPVTDEGFARTANYRGVPFARIGMRVEVAGDPGVIVGKNSSAAEGWRRFHALLDDMDWKVIRVRRLYSKKATAQRSIQTVFKGKREAAELYVSSYKYGGHVEDLTDHKHYRVYTYERDDSSEEYPQHEEFLVAVPAIVRDKQAKSFEAKWKASFSC